MNLEINKNLFAAWCGIIISGYDLFDNDDKDLLFLCNEIKDKLYTDSVSRHFAYSKTNTVECNPYYPRASNLSVYCFYMDKMIDEYYDFLEYCGDAEYRNFEFQEWINASKFYVNKIIQNNSFSKIFYDYCNIINKRFNGIDNQISSVKNKLVEHNLLMNIEIIFAPNLLQSKYLADYVLIDNKLYIISADFSEKTVIHEYLHIIAKSKHKEFEKLLLENDINNFINIREMKKLGYLKNDSIESKIHALEEQFVRYYTDKLTK